MMCLKDFGLWTEYALVAAEDCFVMPESMSYEHAAALGVNYVTAYMMLFEFGNLRPNKSVLVHMAAGRFLLLSTHPMFNPYIMFTFYDCRCRGINLVYPT